MCTALRSKYALCSYDGADAIKLVVFENFPLLLRCDFMFFMLFCRLYLYSVCVFCVLFFNALCRPCGEINDNNRHDVLQRKKSSWYRSQIRSSHNDCLRKRKRYSSKSVGHKTSIPVQRYHSYCILELERLCSSTHSVDLLCTICVLLIEILTKVLKE